VVSTVVRKGAAQTRRIGLQRGFTLVEIMIAVTLVAVLLGVATVALSGHSDEARCLEIQPVLSQMIHSQTFHFLRHNEYYSSSDHEELKDRGVDLSDVKYFTYATFPDEEGTFFVRAEATEWAPGGWVVYKHGHEDPWDYDGKVIKRNWLPIYRGKNQTDKNEPPGHARGKKGEKRSPPGQAKK
jgi:prepilin-type N-terminal cleavage/methylation domain-containing protein